MVNISMQGEKRLTDLRDSTDGAIYATREEQSAMADEILGYRVERRTPVHERKLPSCSESERDAFEYIMENHYGECIDRSRKPDGSGDYVSWDMNVAWHVWRVRAILCRP